MSTAPLETEAVKKVIRRFGMFEKGGKIVAAVSGGCDSSVLLHILWRLSTEMDLEIICAHINHNLRGAESDRDEAFVRSLCEKYGIECRVLSANVAEYAEKHRLSTEEAGRKLRYEFFEHCAEELGENAKIATAHSLSDCAETYIFNSARGAALSGICGI
ncbi:MAG: tRNA lysidine(34) synthetase TilS, partial [Oscillospiraceae bacterium]|nr:tRNA lysidine(34) synthetase TilS [Oscillospiraceae bacterium]